MLKAVLTLLSNSLFNWIAAECLLLNKTDIRLTTGAGTEAEIQNLKRSLVCQFVPISAKFYFKT